MQIGDIKEFKQQQLSKVEKRKKEDEKIKKGIYQMHVMVSDQCMETLMKEQKKAEARTEETRTEDSSSSQEPKSTHSKKTDTQTEMERMLSTGMKIASGIARVV